MIKRIVLLAGSAIAIMVGILTEGATTAVLADDIPIVCPHPHPWGCDPSPPDPWEWD